MEEILYEVLGLGFVFRVEGIEEYVALRRADTPINVLTCCTSV
jgi:hypothetical protein